MPPTRSATWRRPGSTHQQATGVVEVVQGEVIENVATRDYVGEQIALVRKELAEQIGAIRQDLAQETGSIRQELARQIGDTRAELMRALNPLACPTKGTIDAWPGAERAADFA